MYLAEDLIWEGKNFPMAGVLPVVVGVSKKPQGHGYTVAETVKSNSYFSVGQILHGHEFHYSCILNMTEKKGVYFAFKMNKGAGITNKMMDYFLERSCHLFILRFAQRMIIS
jgi:cobyrinic acid a,c-diamide synthase